MKKKLRILEGANQYTDDQLIEIVQSVPDEIDFFLMVNKPHQLKTLAKTNLSKNIRIITGDERNEIEKDFHESDSEFADILQKIIRDESLPLMFERYHVSRNDSEYNINKKHGINFYYADIAAVALRRYLLYKKIKPDFLIWSSTPHNMAPWVSALVAEALNIQVIILRRTFLIDRKGVSIGFRRERKRFKLREKIDNKNLSLYYNKVDEHIQRINSTYADARPDYESKRFNKNKGKYISHLQLIRQHWYRPSWISNTIKCWNTLKKYSVKWDERNKRKYVILFLHYQPERTTLPEGFGFTQQINAIMTLRSCLPASVEVLVKEHPSTFTNMCNKTVRRPEFYQMINDMTGVSLVDITADNFKLIDNALCTCTLTGTAGVESLIRGVPAVFFGVPILYSIHGQYVFENGTGLSRFFKDVISGKYTQNAIQESIKSAMREDIYYSINKEKDIKGRENKTSLLLKIFNDPNVLHKVEFDYSVQ